MVIGLRELVSMFGSEDNKLYYYDNKKLQKKTKDLLLNKAKMKYKVEIIGKGKYELIEKTEFKGMEVSNNMINILSNDFHKILCPIIVNRIMCSHDENSPMEMSLCDVYGALKTIHKHNFNLIRYNVGKASKSFDVYVEFINDYYYHIIDMLRYHLKECLRKLKSENILEWEELEMVKRVNVKVSNINNIQTDVNIEFSTATTEERLYHLELKSNIKAKYKLSNDREITSNVEAYEDYKQELFDKNIDYFYKGFKIWHTDSEICSYFLKYFNDFEEYSYINNFVDALVEKIIKNKEKRITDCGSEYLDYLRALCILTLNHNSINIIDFKSEAVSTTTGTYHNSTTIIGKE